MRRMTFGSALVVTSLMMAAPVFAQTTTTTPTHPTTTTTHPATTTTHPAKKVGQTTATKQKTQSDPTNTYLFKPGSGDYAARAQKQKTDGEDVTGNNNFPAASK